VKKIIELTTKYLTKILTNLLKRLFPHISVACVEFRGKPQIPWHGVKFYMLDSNHGPILYRI